MLGIFRKIQGNPYFLAKYAHYIGLSIQLLSNLPSVELLEELLSIQNTKNYLLS